MPLWSLCRLKSKACLPSLWWWIAPECKLLKAAKSIFQCVCLICRNTTAKKCCNHWQGILRLVWKHKWKSTTRTCTGLSTWWLLGIFLQSFTVFVSREQYSQFFNLSIYLQDREVMITLFNLRSKVIKTSYKLVTVRTLTFVGERKSTFELPRSKTTASTLWTSQWRSFATVTSLKFSSKTLLDLLELDWT